MFQKACIIVKLLVCHRTRYQKYTQKHQLAKQETRGDFDEEKQQVEPPPGQSSSLALDYDHAQDISSGRRTRNQVAKTNKSLRLFCQQKQKQVNHQRHSLSSCMTLEACTKVYEAACIREDERLLLEVHRADLHNCQRNWSEMNNLRMTHPSSGSRGGRARGRPPSPVPTKKKKDPAAQLAAQRVASAWLRTFAPTGNRKSTWLPGVALRFAQFVSF